MKEFFVMNGQLISNEEYTNIINSFKSLNELKDSEEKIIVELRRLVEDAVKERLEGLDSVGIFFSGGLDSSYITALCKKNNTNFTCYTVGFRDGNFKEPEDVEQAIKVAKFLKLDDYQFKHEIFHIKEMEDIFTKTIKILRTSNIDINNVVNVGVGSVVVAAQSICQDEKFFFSGLGSEEIFAGYDRHKKNPSNDECFAGLLQMYERDLIRDSTISKALGFSFITPFLDPELIRYSLKIPIQYKVNEQNSKMILRHAAHQLLKAHAERPKRAAQYGSSFDRALGKIASMHKFKFKKEYIKSIQ